RKLPKSILEKSSGPFSLDSTVITDKRYEYRKAGGNIIETSFNFKNLSDSVFKKTRIYNSYGQLVENTNERGKVEKFRYDESTLTKTTLVESSESIAVFDIFGFTVKNQIEGRDITIAR